MTLEPVPDWEGTSETTDRGPEPEEKPTDSPEVAQRKGTTNRERKPQKCKKPDQDQPSGEPTNRETWEQ